MCWSVRAQFRVGRNVQVPGATQHGLRGSFPAILLQPCSRFGLLADGAAESARPGLPRPASCPCQGQVLCASWERCRGDLWKAACISGKGTRAFSAESLTSMWAQKTGRVVPKLSCLSVQLGEVGLLWSLWRKWNRAAATVSRDRDHAWFSPPLPHGQTGKGPPPTHTHRVGEICSNSSTFAVAGWGSLGEKNLGKKREKTQSFPNGFGEEEKKEWGETKKKKPRFFPNFSFLCVCVCVFSPRPSHL